MQRTQKFAIATAVVCLACTASLWRMTKARAQSGGSPDNIVVQQVVCTSSTSLDCVWTHHNDNTRGGVNPNESILTPSTVGNLTVLKSVTTDGLIYAQPLYVSQISTTAQGTNCGGGTQTRNMVYVATENDSVYAFDDVAADTNPCWQTSVMPTGETPVPYTSLPEVPDSKNSNIEVPCTDLVPQVGITSTPVIDINVNPPLMYVLAKTVDSGGTFHFRLHVIKLRDGTDLTSFDVGSNVSAFNPAVLNQRSGLALYHSGNSSFIYMSFGSLCDSNVINGAISTTPYTGWLAAFDVDYSGGGSVPSVLSTNYFQVESSPTSSTKGGIWMGGGAPAIDNTHGTVFLAPRERPFRWLEQVG